MQQVGLFPLNIVLFPEASYPLHIFEERYKQLIGESLANNTPFGINLIESGKMFQVGCLAVVSQVTNRHEDGRMDIVVTGTERYNIIEVRSDDAPYMVADIETFQDEEHEVEYSETEGIIALYNELMEAVYGEAEERLVVQEWISRSVSFHIVQKSGLDLVLRQQLLEMRNESDRISFLTNHLKNILPKIKETERLRMLSRNDGYISPDSPIE